jgi:hypothetical protein
MTDYNDEAAAQRYADPENLTPVGPALPLRNTRRNLAKHVPVRFSAELIAAVKHLADLDGTTVSTWIRTVVSREVDRRQRRPETTHSPGGHLDITSPPQVAETQAMEAMQHLQGVA